MEGGEQTEMARGAVVRYVGKVRVKLLHAASRGVGVKDGLHEFAILG